MSPDHEVIEAQTSTENPASGMFQVDIAARSHPGTDTPTNKNHFLVVRAQRLLETMSTNLPENALPRRFDDVAYGMLVAAGMGGMPAGEMASAMALCKLVELVVKTPDWIMKMDGRQIAVVQHRMKDRFRRVDRALRQRTEGDPELVGMSTTLTLACSLGADLFLGHIGDSRAYLMRNGDLHQLTRDHTLAQALIDAGIGRPQDTIVRGMRRVLTAALGAAQLKVEPQIQHLPLCPDDQLLLCTNGFTEAVDTETIASLLRNPSSSEEACRALMAVAANGGNDPVTLILAQYRSVENQQL